MQALIVQKWLLLQSFRIDYFDIVIYEWHLTGTDELHPEAPMARIASLPESLEGSKRVEVETISLRLPKPLMTAIRAHCAKHADTGAVLGMQPPTISSVIRQLVEERFAEEAGKADAAKRSK
jgi:hypothetical protein